METLSSRIPGLAGASITFVLSLALAAPARSQAHGAPHWTYEGADGPTHWADLSPDFALCKAGSRQSPIDIRDAKPADLPAIQFNYQPMPLQIIDNGHTIMITADPGSFITVGGHRYELKQFHFHAPSEETIDGNHFAMVAHLVHADSAGRLAVVAVLLTEGQDNPSIDALWHEIPTVKGKTIVHADVRTDASTLLPGDRGYYTFAGSLTTPPCSEHVTWYVLKQPLAIGSAQVAQFKKFYADNARPTQPTNGRPVQETK
jgi:carbonic anhydrase